MAKPQRLFEPRRLAGAAILFCGLALTTVIALSLLALGLRLAVEPARAAPLASDWFVGNHTRARLIAAPFIDPAGKGPPRIYAGVHLEMDDGWKTYWRTPGEAGGIPPSFDWSGSVNLAAAKVLYPVPIRIPGPYGETIGYKHEIVFPVHLEAKDPSRPIELNLVFNYGVCLDICIPAEGRMRLVVPPRVAATASTASLIARYLARVPGYGRRSGKIERLEARLEGRAPQLIIEAKLDEPSAAEEAELFVEAPDGLYIPSPAKTPLDASGRVRFRVDLTKGEDPALLKGRTLRLTLASREGQIEMDWPIR